MRAGTLVKGLLADSDAVISRVVRYYRCLENSGRQRGRRPSKYILDPDNHQIEVKVRG